MRVTEKAKGNGRAEESETPLDGAESIIGRVIEAGIARLGITQTELARRSGITQTQISRLMNGSQRAPGFGTVVRIARALQIDVNSIAEAYWSEFRGRDCEVTIDPPAPTSDVLELTEMMAAMAEALDELLSAWQVSPAVKKSVQAKLERAKPHRP